MNRIQRLKGSCLAGLYIHLIRWWRLYFSILLHLTRLVITGTNLSWGPPPMVSIIIWNVRTTRSLKTTAIRLRRATPEGWRKPAGIPGRVSRFFLRSQFPKRDNYPHSCKVRTVFWLHRTRKVRRGVIDHLSAEWPHLIPGELSAHRCCSTRVLWFAFISPTYRTLWNFYKHDRTDRKRAVTTTVTETQRLTDTPLPCCDCHICRYLRASVRSDPAGVPGCR